MGKKNRAYREKPPVPVARRQWGEPEDDQSIGQAVQCCPRGADVGY